MCKKRRSHKQMCWAQTCCARILRSKHVGCDFDEHNAIEKHWMWCEKHNAICARDVDIDKHNAVEKHWMWCKKHHAGKSIGCHYQRSENHAILADWVVISKEITLNVG